jgi:hypothetical protein
MSRALVLWSLAKILSSSPMHKYFFLAQKKMHIQPGNDTLASTLLWSPLNFEIVIGTFLPEIKIYCTLHIILLCATLYPWATCILVPQCKEKCPILWQATGTGSRAAWGRDERYLSRVVDNFLKPILL